MTISLIITKWESTREKIHGEWDVGMFLFTTVHAPLALNLTITVAYGITKARLSGAILSS